MPKKATELIEQTLDRLHATEPMVHAYVHIDEKQARATAALADTTPAKGPLHGLPFAVKEVIEVAGIPTAGGSQVFQDHIPSKDATVVLRLREAGAVLVGTQVSHELTCGLDEPPTRNPWDLNCYPGGSSAGAGVSVAAGSASVALGTDAAGSVRIPAAMTGVVGMKPTAGLVSQCGVLRQASAPSIDNIGIITRRVSEVGDVLDVIAAPDPADAMTLRGIAAVETEALPDVEGLRIAVLGKTTRAILDEVWILDKEIESAFAKACAQLENAGAKLITIELPSLTNALSAIVTFFSTELTAAHRELLHERFSDYHPAVYAMLKETMDTPESALVNAVRSRACLCTEVFEVFNTAGVELLMTPTTPRVAMSLSTFDPTQELGSLIPYTCGFNLTGQPAISVPCGFTSAGLPIGLQIVGLPYKDALVLRLAHIYEQRNSWYKRHPKI